MPYVSISEFETRLQWRSDSGALLSGDGAPPIPVGKWNPETLLVAAVEGRTLLAFMEQARTLGVEVLFYQSSAMARCVEGQDGAPHYTDLIVRPHVTVRTEEDARRAQGIFEALPERCFPSSMLRLTPRIEPLIDTWHEQHAAELENARRGRSPATVWRP